MTSDRKGTGQRAVAWENPATGRIYRSPNPPVGSVAIGMRGPKLTPLFPAPQRPMTEADFVALAKRNGWHEDWWRDDGCRALLRFVRAVEGWHGITADGAAIRAEVG